MRKILSGAALAAVTLMGASAPAHAFLVLDFDDVTSAVSASCNGSTLAGCGATLTYTVNNPNSIDFSGTIGVFSIVGTGAVSNSPGNAAFARVSINTLDIKNTSGGAAILDIHAFGTNFSLPAGPALTLFSSGSMTSSELTADGTVRSRGFSDATNTMSVAGVATTCTMAISTASACSASTVPWARGVGMFGISYEQRITLGAGDTISTTGQTIARQAVPEPASLALVGLALAGAGVASRRRKA